MIKVMRVRLVLNFLCLVLVLYSAGAVVCLIVFNQGLNKSTESLLVDLISEIRPSVTSSTQCPTLKEWDSAARREHLPVLATIQIFDNNKKLLESYGPPGVDILNNGRMPIPRKNAAVRSSYQPIVHEARQCGFLQVQVSTIHDDHVFLELATAMILAFPVLTSMVTIGGYYFVSLALRPVETTMDLLRRFVADAGHELKTPLAVVEAAVETLEAVHKEHHLPETETDMIRAASKRMKRLTEDLIFLARVEDPTRAFEKVALSLNELIVDEIQEYMPIAASKDITLNQTLPEEPLQILAEPESFRELVSNLFSNAIKYNKPGGQVHISLQRVGTFARITVTDTGVGIPAPCISHLFERFYRADQSRSRQAGGAGLGLAIVKAVAEAHKATIDVESVEDKGSTFSVTVPIIRFETR